LNFRTYIIGLLLFCFSLSSFGQNKAELTEKYVLVIHGGAGTIVREKMTPELETEYSKALNEALMIGKQILDTGGLAVYAVEAVVKYMEDSPLFNAGKGAVFNSDGKNEMDACIMDGRDLSCGSVSGVRNLKNPIEGARLVKDSSEHVFLYGDKAQDFCLSKGATYADSSYFYTELRWKQYLKAKEKEKVILDHDTTNLNYQYKILEELQKFGTVGAVALDRYGNVAAATSTGGLTNKKHGRIGDSPIVGAGTYADNQSCAVSCTGKGEDFIRATVARDIAAQMEFGNRSLKKSAERTMKKLNNLDGSGGFIAVDRKGNFVMLFNTKGMYRGSVSNEEKPNILIYED
jgi:beta-aspartyl-peptidase (threonine type)